jgi:hypothetical protein
VVAEKLSGFNFGLDASLVVGLALTVRDYSPTVRSRSP